LQARQNVVPLNLLKRPYATAIGVRPGCGQVVDLDMREVDGVSVTENDRTLYDVL